MQRRLILVCAIALSVPGSARAQFLDTGQVNPEFLRTDPAIVGWATGVAASQRGPQDSADPGLGLADFGLETDPLGSAGTAFSLGDGGSLTLTFDPPIANGPGPDLAVFENGFAFSGLVYAELGFVEVSSNGVDFARLPSISRTGAPVASFDGMPASDTYNLAGNHVGGTGLDLQDLLNALDPLVLAGTVDLTAITHVRVVDVIGDWTHDASLDFFGASVADPYPTAFGSGGMDLTGVAVLNAGGVVATHDTSWGRVKSLY